MTKRIFNIKNSTCMPTYLLLYKNIFFQKKISLLNNINIVTNKPDSNQYIIDNWYASYKSSNSNLYQ